MQRFNDTTLRLFAKHGMEIVQIGQTALGPNSFGELVYVLAFKNLDDMDRKLAAFAEDPEWRAAEPRAKPTDP